MKPTEREMQDTLGVINQLNETRLFDILHENKDFDPSAKLYNWDNENTSWQRDSGIEIQWGATKLCIFSDELSNWVIKCDLHPNSGGTQYSKVEFENYLASVGENLSDYFAETYSIGRFYDIDFFLQERLIPMNHSVDTIDNVFEQITRSGELGDYFPFDKEYDFDNDDDIEEAVSGLTQRDVELIVSNYLCEFDQGDLINLLYPEDIAEDLMYFMDEFEINDVHMGNIGIFKPNEAEYYKIFDFSGYFYI